MDIGYCPRCNKPVCINIDYEEYGITIEKHYCSFECLFADESDPRSSYLRPKGMDVDDIKHYSVVYKAFGNVEHVSERIQAFDDCTARSRAYTQALQRYRHNPDGPRFDGTIECIECKSWPSPRMARKQAETRFGRFRQWWNGDRKTWWDSDEQVSGGR